MRTCLPACLPTRREASAVRAIVFGYGHVLGRRRAFTLGCLFRSPRSHACRSVHLRPHPYAPTHSLPYTLSPMRLRIRLRLALRPRSPPRVVAASACTAASHRRLASPQRVDRRSDDACVRACVCRRRRWRTCLEWGFRGARRRMGTGAQGWGLGTMRARGHDTRLWHALVWEEKERTSCKAPRRTPQTKARRKGNGVHIGTGRCWRRRGRERTRRRRRARQSRAGGSFPHNVLCRERMGVRSLFVSVSVLSSCFPVLFLILSCRSCTARAWR
ncbi:hypothetical protein B0H17DRAFT_1331427 [Mycena rosella]|uniref:Uncharacterized protein n=1 Tax=Mycena rosella TaxID=1033263 RepID=A0AAD7GE11_MYCRO|nr:hypothetical protein B0H17DRAFT_1331427 [Mycena rosella]